MTKEQKREKWRDEEKEEEEKESIRRSERHFRTKRERENGMKTETKQHILAVIFFVVAGFSLLSVMQLGGVAGQFFYDNFRLLFGVGYYFIPILFILLGVSFYRGEQIDFGWLHFFGSLVFLLAGLALTEILFSSGGVVGYAVAWPFLKLFGAYASVLFLLAFLTVSLLLIFQGKLTFEPILRVWKKINPFGFFLKVAKRLKFKEAKINLTVKSAEAEEEGGEEKEETGEEKQVTAGGGDKKTEENKKTKLKITAGEDLVEVKLLQGRRGGKYTPPPLSLLGSDQGVPGVGDVKANANIIKRTLENFGISVEMDEITIGPTITRYALKPAEGVRLAKIAGLQNDLALALAAHPLRIEAPIPGKSLVGIEVPNKKKSIVGLYGLLEDSEFAKATRPLVVPFGRGLSGRGVYASITKAPHMLIAGTTGSGKSVTIHTIITSLLYKYSPEELRFILIDPKRVELTFYNKIPHLLAPVITDPKKAILALRFAAREMEKRYGILEAEGARDIASYHQKMGSAKKVSGTFFGERLLSGAKKVPDTFSPMPYIIIIIDELADIMSTFPRELEASIVRLAQMSRAVGIHLILSTQRPSVNVITGLIKANIPTRVALQVSSQIDSRTILDMAGAEKLLGSGDMLYLASDKNQPERIQSAFISEEEVKKVVNFIAEHNEGGEDILSFSEEGQSGGSLSMNLESGAASEDEDPLFEEAKRLVMEAGKASTSYLQRRLKVGYSRAARLIDLLEERGVVGPADGAKPREVIGGSGGEKI